MAMAVVTIASWLDRRLLQLLAFDPAGVLSGHVWRLVSWVLVQDSPLTLFFAAFMLWWLGQQLVYVWGERSFLLRFFGITLGAGVLATLVAVVYPPAAVGHINAWPTVNALSCGRLRTRTARSPGSASNMTAKMMAALVVFGTVLYAIAYGGPGQFVVHSRRSSSAGCSRGACSAASGGGRGGTWRSARRAAGRSTSRSCAAAKGRTSRRAG